MKVLFLNPPTENHRKITRNFDCASESKGNYLLQPFDFLNMSSFIPEEFDFEFIDAVASKMEKEKVLSKKSIDSSNVIIMSMAYSSWENDIDFLRDLRKITNAKIYVFGDIFIESESLKNVEHLSDGVISSPMEFSVILNNEGDIEVSGLKGVSRDIFDGHKKPQLKTFKIPRHEVFQHENYRWPFASYFKYTSITLTWGCPYSCSYCIESNFPLYYRNLDEVKIEIRKIASLGIRELYFADKSFGFMKKYTTSVLDWMIEKNFQFSWSTYFHPNQFSEELLDKMKLSGCHTIIVGVEDFDESVLKNYGRSTKNHKIKEMIDYCKKIKVNVCADYIFGLKEHDHAHIKKIIDYSINLNTDYASFNIASPLPGSIIKKEAIADGRLTINDYGHDSVGKDKALDAKHIKAGDLINLRNHAVKKFYMRPTYLFKRIFKIRTFQHFIIQLQEMLELFKKAN
jgi:radical SAM superfamily enzyme YgiQ (UPF0313 family)